MRISYWSSDVCSSDLKRSVIFMPLMPALGIQSLVSAVLFLPLAAADGPLAPELTGGFIAAVAWFIVFSTIAAYGLYWLCLKRSTATRIARLRSAERRVGKECGSTCRSWWWAAT